MTDEGRKAKSAIVGEVRQAIQELAAPVDKEVCKSHAALSRAMSLTLRLLLPLYEQAPSESTEKIKLPSGGPSVAFQWILSAINPFTLLILYFIAKKEGWL